VENEEEPLHAVSNKRPKTNEDSILSGNLEKQKNYTPRVNEKKAYNNGEESNLTEKGEEATAGVEEKSDAYDFDVVLFFQAKCRLVAIQEQITKYLEANHGKRDSDYSFLSQNKMDLLVACSQMINHAGQNFFAVKKVAGNHRAGCDDCEQIPRFGEYYAVDQSSGVFFRHPKICEACVARRSDLLFHLSQDTQRYARAQKMRKQLDEKCSNFSPWAPGGLFEVGPDAPFCLRESIGHFDYILGGNEAKTFEEHMRAKTK